MVAERKKIRKMKNGKTYAAEEFRKKAKVVLGGLGNGVITMPSQASSRDVAAMLRYAADIVERCEDYIKTMQECGDNMNSKIIEDILTKILRGDAGKEAK